MQQLYNYQDIISKQPIYHLCKKNDRYFYEIFILIKLENFYDKHIKVTLCEGIQGFTTKDIYSVKDHVYYQLYLLEGYSSRIL